MALTNAEKQKRTRKRKADKLSRYEAALLSIVEVSPREGARASGIAQNALYGDLRAQLVASVAKQKEPHNDQQ